MATAFSFLDNYSREQSFALEKVDLWVLAVGFVRTIPVVSDDRTLCEVGQIHGIECWSTLHLLKLMVEHCRISVEEANSTLEYLQHENDLPMGIQALRQRYLALFGQPCRL